MELVEGKLIGRCMPRHRHQEFLKFLRLLDAQTPVDLDLHLILDNYSTHKHDREKSWLKRHPRFHLHFTPMSSSWLNLVERWFREITATAIRSFMLPVGFSHSSLTKTRAHFGGRTLRS